MTSVTLTAKRISFRRAMLGALLFLPCLLGAQPQAHRLSFRQLDITSGLSQNSINGILQDDRGFLWIGTQDGLNRYDGYSFVTYKQGIGLSNALSHSYTLGLCLDRTGSLWIGTERGLNRLDLGSERFSLYVHEPGNPNSLAGNRVADVFEAASRPGEIWAATNAGLDCLDVASGRFRHYARRPGDPASLPANAVNVVYEAPSLPGVIWAGTDAGLARIDQRSNGLSVLRHDPKNQASLGHDSVWALYEAPSLPGVLWIGTLNGLTRLDLSSGAMSTFRCVEDDPATLSHNRVRAIIELSHQPGYLWIGTYGGGMSRFNVKTSACERFTYNPQNPSGVRSNFVIRFYEDRAGNFWIGTETGGLNLYSPSFKNFLLFRNVPDDRNSLISNNVRGFSESRVDRGILWIATYGGLSRFDRNTRQFTHFLQRPQDPGSLSTNLLRCVHEDSRGDLWVGTYDGGLNLRRRGTERFVHFQHVPGDERSISANNIRVIVEAANGDLWLATVGGGLCRYDRAANRFFSYRHDPRDPESLSDNRIYSLCLDPAGWIWVGSGNGLNRFDPRTGKSRQYHYDPRDPTTLSSDMVYSVLIDRRGAMWIGTWGGGLSRFDPRTGRFTHFREEQGLANNVVYGMQEDRSGLLWLTTNHGISRFDPVAEKFKSFDERDGLQSNEFNHGACYRSPGGRLYMGGIGGFNSFVPEEIGDNPRQPPVLITRFLLFNKPVRVGERFGGRQILTRPISDTRAIELGFRENILAFEFTALNFINPEKNQYAYMLEGLEDDWNYVGNRRFAAYTTLPPGRYVFRVKGSNNDDVWNEAGAAIAIRIYPPFWKTWWFLGLCGLAVLGGAGSLVYARVTRLERRRRELEQIVSARTQELSQTNSRLSQLNDELKKLSIVASKTETGVIIMSAEGDLEWVNEGFVRVHGTLEEIVATRGRNLTQASRNPNIREIYDRVVREKQSVIYDTQSQGRDGNISWWQTTLTPILDEKGRIAKLIAIDSDVTRIKEAEEEIRRQKEMISSQKGLLEQAIQELERLATHDGLTGIANHRHFYDFYEKEWKRAMRTRRPVSLIMADVDFFKDYNDAFGHQFGDQCLKRIAQILAESVRRPTDLVARYGGEEFIVILSETDSAGAAMMAEKIRAAVEERASADEHGRKERLTISLGVATTVPQIGSESSLLIRAADKALYHSKQTGRNRVSVADMH